MSSQDKMLALLDAFSVDAPVWSAEELAARSGRPVAVVRTGLLARVGSDLR